MTGETAIIGTFSSVATASMAMVEGARCGADQKIDLLFFDELARVAGRGRGIGAVVELDQLDLLAVDLLLYSMAAWMPRPYGMPIEAPGPLSDVTNPIVMSACAVEAATRPPMSAVKLNILRIAFPWLKTAAT